MIIFLDIDGVLNSHQPHPNGYCGISPECTQRFNSILNEFPDIRLVISSSWRYLVHSGSMTIEGLENLFLSHGLWFRDKIEGITRKDKEIDIDEWDSREEQIMEYVNAAGLKRWIVIDDLPLEINNFYRTNGEIGLTDIDMCNIKLILEWDRENPINV
jgi:hypothetical protein